MRTVETMRARPARGAEGRRLGPAWSALPVLLAGCGGGPQPAPPPAGAAEAQRAPAQTAAPLPPPPARWSPPEGFRVIVPALGGETHPRVIGHMRTGVELLRVPAGSFVLGSAPEDEGHSDDESPAREVALSAFYLARTEVTLVQWKRGGGARGRGAGDDHPVVDVTWGDVDAWCRANGLELPSEAQWEYAASGPENRVFPWGARDEPFRTNALGTIGMDRWDDTAPVGSFPGGSAWCGAYDLAGNVAEWCADRFFPDYAGLPEGSDPVRLDGGTEAHGICLLYTSPSPRDS